LSKMERLLLLLSSLLATAQTRPQFFATDLSATVVQSFNSKTDFKDFKAANAVFHTPEDDDIFRQLDQEFDSFYGPQQYDENAEYELIEYPVYDSRAEIGTPVSGSGSGFFFGSNGAADTSSSKDRFNEIFDQQANNRGNSNNNNNRGSTNRGQTGTNGNNNRGQSAGTSSRRGPPITASGVQPFRGASVTSAPEQPKGARFPVASSQNNGGRPSIRTPVNPPTTRRTTRRPTTRRTTTAATTTTRRPTTPRATTTTTTRTTSTEEPRIPKIFPNSGKLDPFTEAPLGNKIGGTPGPRRKGPSFKIKLKFPKRRRGNNRSSTTTAAPAPAEDRSGSSRSEGGRSTGREGFSYSDLLEAGQAGQPVTRTEADAPNEFDVYHAVPNY